MLFKQIVLQQNKSAAASEELSGQAQMMKQMVGQFKIRDVSTYQDET